MRKKIKGSFDCRSNKNLKNIKQQLIEYEIEAETYYTDEGFFSFEEIKKEIIIKKQKINNKKLRNVDFRISI